MANAPEKTTSRPRRGQTTRSRPVTASSATRRRRGANQPTEVVLADLDQMISLLIKQNRELHRQLDKLSQQAGGASSGASERALRSIQRRISSAVDGATATTRRRRSGPANRTQRKITDPEVLERRRQALVKARAARVAKRERG